MGSNELLELGYRLGMYFVPFLFALCFHEFAHGMVAKWRGDRTAERAGRLTLNPMDHADPLGTWILPIGAILLNSPFFFGWAKPVPVDARNLKKPKQDMFWVALAGPLSNILMAVVAAIALGLVVGLGGRLVVAETLIQLLRVFISVNLFLAIFNLIPIHPLDGGKVIEPFLPIRWNMWLEENQGMLSMVLMLGIFLIGGVLAVPVGIASELLLNFAMAIAHIVG